MSSTLQQAVTVVQLTNYVSLVIITVMTYDYILTFSEEVEYIWKKPWTFVSTLFVLARYFGLSTVLLCAVLTKLMNLYYTRCDIIFLTASWSVWIFGCSADHKVVMILRLWAIYNRSKFVLGTLLVFYVANAVLFFIIFVIYSKGSDATAGTSQVLWYSVCTWGQISMAWGGVVDAVQIALGTLMCLLIVVQFIKESLQMYKVAKRLHINQYMKRLVWEGMVYFFAMLLYAVVNLLSRTLPWSSSNAWQILPLGALEQMPPFILIPRFVLGLRGLHARNLQDSDIDTPFGLGSVSRSGTAASTLVFADAEENDGEEQRREGQVEEVVQGIPMRQESSAS